MRAALAHLAARPAAAGASPCSATWPSSAPGAPAFHQEIGARPATLGVDRMVAVGELARGYLAGAPGCRSPWAPDAESAVAAVEAAVRPGDAVLVKASRAVGLERVAEALAAVTA